MLFRSDTWICTATYNSGYIDREHFAVLKRYGIGLRRTDPYLMKAYDLFGPKLASYIHKNNTMKTLSLFLTGYYRDVMQNNSLTPSQKIWGFTANYILRPVYRVIGLISVLLGKI